MEDLPLLSVYFTDRSSAEEKQAPAIHERVAR
jgi:hypothetical protein